MLNLGRAGHESVFANTGIIDDTEAMLPIYFVFASAVLNLASGASYIFSTLKGITKPNRVTWLLWTIAPLIVVVAQIKNGVGLSTLAVFAISLVPGLILLASFFNKNAYWKISFLDYTCGAASLMGLLLWAVTTNAILAILFGIVSDFLAAVPTIRKAYFYPESEDGPAFIIGAVACIIGVLAVQQASFSGYGFISYTVFMNTFIALIIYRKRLQFS